MGSSRHSGGDRGDWQDQPQPWEDDPYSSQQSHQPSGPPKDDNSHWSQAPGRGGPAGGSARWAQPPPSWGNDAVSEDPRWAEQPAWADEAHAGDDGHWARTTGNGTDYWDDDQYQAQRPGADPYRTGPHGTDPYQAGRHGADPYHPQPDNAGPYQADPYGADPYQAEPHGADPYRAGSYGAAPPGGGPYPTQPPGAASVSAGGDPYQAGPYGPAAAPPGGGPPDSGPYRGQPYGATAPPDDDLYWARPSGTGAPPPDDDPYWGQPPQPLSAQYPPGQEADWAADPEAWGAEGTIPVPPPWGSVTGEPEDPDDPTRHADVLSGPGGSTHLDGIPPRRRRKFPVLVAVLVVVALIAAIVIVKHWSPGNTSAGPTPAQSAPAGGTPSGSRPSATKTTHVKQPPVTAANTFPQTKLDLAGLRFIQVATSNTTECSTAARGTFASALSSADCKRVVRATYVDTSKQYVVTVGVASLPTHTDAVSADRAKHFGPDVWFTALDGPTSSGAGSASKNAGVGDDVVDYRFIVFALSGYTDGHNPSGDKTEIKTLTRLSEAFSGEAEKHLVSRGGWS